VEQNGGPIVYRTANSKEDVPLDQHFDALIGCTGQKTPPNVRLYDGKEGVLQLEPVAFTVLEDGKQMPFILSAYAAAGWRQCQRSKASLFLQPLSAQAAAALGQTPADSSSAAAEILLDTFAALNLSEGTFAADEVDEVALTKADWDECFQLLAADVDEYTCGPATASGTTADLCDMWIHWFSAEPQLIF
jgi:hypothetical protein